MELDTAPQRNAAVLVRLVTLGGLPLLAIAVSGHYLSWPLLTSTLGPTLYVFIAHPSSESSRFRNAVLGHGAAVATGLIMLALFGLWSHSSMSVVGRPDLRQAGAAAVGVGLTLALLHLLDAHHAPAAATSLLITTGLARPGKPLYSLLVGLAAIILIGPLLGRLPLGRPQLACRPGRSTAPSR